MTHNFTGLAHDFTGHPRATEQNASVTKLSRQKTWGAGQMRLLWVAVFHNSSECTSIILVVGWRAACWNHLREGPGACQRSWSEWEDNNVYCYIFCFLSLYLLICSFIPLYLCTTSFVANQHLAALIFCMFCVQSLSSFPCKYLFKSAIYCTDGLPLFHSTSLFLAESPASLDTACPLLLLCVRVISKNLMTL